MNSLYSLGLRQVSSLQTELNNLEQSISKPTNTAISHGPIVASLTSLQRTIDDYETMNKGEVIEVKREKSFNRIQKFREDYSNLKKQFDRIKLLEKQAVEDSKRNELFGQTSTTFRNNATTTSSDNSINQNLYRTNSSINNKGITNYRTNSALDENQFVNQTNNTLDIYIAQGQAILGNLGDQREMLKGTQKKLRSAANALGLSRETIQFIERRTKGDFIILLIGSLCTFLSFYYILKFFG
ncbi:hypothetical protein CROQUDRAFT_43801 [Cronartium quercuum f. sp. fusiforme G11]|uniref:Protein transport protein BOS1 n=1 Tax=Cronartium quercuum f. sp. fusiforme G11 TaxID=708437 RepID=A0A9P6NNS0_9BASI|nr:hypothetical protein CROQUDRAFT_43801 [Cronartium quercuum f. sp. fusiforme G11]